MIVRVRPGVRALLATAAFCLAAAPWRTAAADPRACIHAHSTGQRESKAGHLRLASQLFTSCGSDETCPDQLRKECAEFLQDVTRTIPTVVFSALDENGHDLASARVYSGDELLADGLNGRDVEIDPGRYHLRFVLQGGDTLVTDVVVREGEKQRLVQVKKDRPILAVETTASPGAHGDTSSGRGPAPWIAAGVTAIALGTGVTLAVMGTGDKSDLDRCKPACSSDQHATYDSAKGLLLGADIGFGAALVAGALTGWLFLSESSHEAAPASKEAATRRIWFAGSPLPGGGSVGMVGRFE